MSADVAELVGKVFRSVTSNDSEVVFTGDVSFRLYHDQDCCESVGVEDVCGDLSDLEGQPIISATCDSRHADVDEGAQQWTFYHLRTIKGTVTIRFYGTSNGYYSTSVTLARVGGGEP